MSRRNSIENNNNSDDSEDEDPFNTVILPSVFRFLSARDLMSAEQVNRAWRSQANRISLWARLSNGCVSSENTSHHKMVAQLREWAPTVFNLFMAMAQENPPQLHRAIIVLSTGWNTTPKMLLTFFAMLEHLLPCTNFSEKMKVSQLFDLLGFLCVKFKMPFTVVAGMTTYLIAMNNPFFLVLVLLIGNQYEKYGEKFLHWLSKKDCFSILMLTKDYMFTIDHQSAGNDPLQYVILSLNAIGNFFDNRDAEENRAVKELMLKIDINSPDVSMFEKFGATEFKHFIVLTILDRHRVIDNKPLLNLLKRRCENLFESLYDALDILEASTDAATLSDAEILEQLAVLDAERLQQIRIG